MRGAPQAIVPVIVGLLVLGATYAATADDRAEDGADEVLVVYGEAPSEFGLLSIPESGRHVPVVVLVHGGFWRVRLGDTSLMAALSADLVERGWAVWNIEYGRTGEVMGGWPHTFEHVASAIDHLDVLAHTYPIDSDRVAVVGHSAGGHLAIWSGGRTGLDRGDPGSDPIVDPLLVVGLAPVLDVESAARDGLGRGAVVDLLGGLPETVPERYRVAAPARGDAEVVVVLGIEDDIVPDEYAVVPALGAESITVAGANHFSLIDPESAAWAAAVSYTHLTLPTKVLVG